MKKKLITLLAIGSFVVGLAGVASALTLIDNNSSGYYNNSIGNLLDGTNPTGNTYLFPNANSNPNDPTLNPVPYEPDLSTASTVLGDWLLYPASLNTNWSDETTVPSTWAVNDETAIIYKIDAGANGLDNVVAQLGVDNGIFVWLDGVFANGWLAPGGAGTNEYQVAFGSLAAGSHYLQLLREDHGGGTGYNISVAGDSAAPVPEPATFLLLGSGLAGLAFYRRKRK